MTDRLASALEDVVTLLLPKLQAGLVFYAQWEMSVLTVSPPSPPAAPGSPVAVFTTPAYVTCLPIDPTVAALLPPQVQIPLVPGPSGVLSVPAPGSTVRVGFANADPSKPYIAGLDPKTMPTVGLVGALRVITAANTATWVGAAAFAAVLETLG